MAAVVVALVVLAIVGAGRARLGGWLGVGVALAGWLVATTQVTAVWGFSPRLIAAASLAVAVAAWFAPRLAAGGAADEVQRDLATELRLLGVVAVVLLLPLWLLPVPLDTDAQGFGQLALAVRDGGSFTTLAPFRPGIAYLYAPGGPVLFASLSSLLPGVAMSDIMMGASHALTLLFVALAGDLGEELARSFASTTRTTDTVLSADGWRRLAQLVAVTSPGLWTTLLDAHYTAILGMTVGMVALVAWFRAWRTHHRRAFVAGSVAIAALVVAHQDMALAVAFGLVPLAIAAMVAAPPDRRLGLTVATVSAVAFAAVLLAPWWLAIAPLVATGIASPFQPSGDHWRQLVLYHGILWPLLAVVGAMIGLRQRLGWTLAMVCWIGLLVDVSLSGGLATVAPRLTAPLHRFAYPFSLAWHGPVLPYLALATVALAAFAQRWHWRVEGVPGPRTTAAVILSLVIATVAAPWILAGVAGRAPFYGALASRNDVAAMRWLERHAASDARILNYPGDLPGARDWEGHWAPVLTERDCVYFRMQPFFLDDPRSPATGAVAAAVREQEEMLGFWRNPNDRDRVRHLTELGIRYVLMPEAVGDPASLGRSWRGRPPALLDGRPPPPLAADFLDPVFQAGGATVYELRRPG
jgi:hypothetical protein